MVRRALVGWKEPVYQGGKEVGTIRKFSDNLLIFLLKGKRPEVFRERHELTGANGAALTPAVVHRLALSKPLFLAVHDCRLQPL
jgi:hypothetical protein